MAWALVEEQLPDLYAVIDEVESTVASALTKAIGRFGRPGDPPLPEGPEATTGTWSIAWFQPLSARISADRVLVFQVEVAGGPTHPIASAWVAVVHVDDHNGNRIIEHELWRSSRIPVHCPLDAAVAIRRVSAELGENLEWLDLEPYLSDKPAEPGATAAGGGM